MIWITVRATEGRSVLILYKFRSNSDLCLTGDLRQMLPGVIAYGILFDLNLYHAQLPPDLGLILV